MLVRRDLRGEVAAEAPRPIDDPIRVDNVDAQRGYVLAETVVSALAPSVGHRRAHELVRGVSVRGRERGWTLLEALAAEPAVTEHLPVTRLEALLRAEPALDAQIDRVLRPGP